MFKAIFILTLAFLSHSIVDRTYYIYLGLPISASHSQIQASYEQKKSNISALEDEEAKAKKMKLLEEAYAVLGNVEKRKQYDRFNKDIIQKPTLMASAKKVTQKNYRKDSTMKITLPVSVEDVFHGRTVEAKYIKKEACHKCRGTGAESGTFFKACPRCAGQGFEIREQMTPYGQKFVNEMTCSTCNGWGKHATKKCPVCQGSQIVERVESVEIKIPEGLPDGNVIEIANFGDESLLGAPSDLQVTIIEIPTEKWSRQQNDLIYLMEISLEESIFGFEKELQHLSGDSIPVSRSQVTSKDTVITVTGQGIKNRKTGKSGNLRIKFKIRMPTFSDRQLDLWEQFFQRHKI